MNRSSTSVLRCCASIVALLALAVVYSGVHYWRQWASERRLVASSRVSVVVIRPTFPPELVVEFENTGDARIRRTHFRLGFEVDGREISHADQDVLDILPKEKRQVTLRSRPSGSLRFAASGAALRVTYVLVVLPEWLKGVPTTSGTFLLERYEFPFEVVYAPQLDRGNLSQRFDVMIFVTGAIPGADGRPPRTQPDREVPSVPPEFKERVGSITQTVTQTSLRM